MTQRPDFFDDLYRRDADPWQVHTRWYEQRKQALLLAALPHRRYGRAFETACGTGALTSALAERCDELLASDASETAVRITQAHLARQGAASHVSVVRQALPADWPSGRFDLIVVSEWAYYISHADLQALAQACGDSLAPKGCLVACHWRPDFPDRRHTTDALHALLGDHPGWTRMVHHQEEDFLLDVWSPGGPSVARATEPDADA
ncbi:MAG TPA: nodulation S family protein [Candidatus Aquabacterium excrementipullorum]|nr:nodulation S family protein [Candidatus Aquabacterium excrementipullorum]